MKTLKLAGLESLLTYALVALVSAMFGFGVMLYNFGYNTFSISGGAMALIGTATIAASATFVFHLFYSGMVKRAFIATKNTVSDAIHSVLRPVVLKKLELNEAFVLKLAETKGVISLKTLEDLVNIARQMNTKINPQFFAGISNLGLAMGFKLTYLEDARKVISELEDVIAAIPQERQNAEDFHNKIMEGIENQRRTAIANFEKTNLGFIQKEETAKSRKDELAIIVTGVEKGGFLQEQSPNDGFATIG